MLGEDQPAILLAAEHCTDLDHLPGDDWRADAGVDDLATLRLDHVFHAEEVLTGVTTVPPPFFRTM